MECSRCGGEAVVKRDNAVYCGKCALARDWEEVIHVVQADRLVLDTKPAGGGPASKPAASPADGESVGVAGTEVALSDEAPGTAQATPPADPFG